MKKWIFRIYSCLCKFESDRGLFGALFQDFDPPPLPLIFLPSSFLKAGTARTAPPRACGLFPRR